MQKKTFLFSEQKSRCVASPHKNVLQVLERTIPFSALYEIQWQKPEEMYRALESRKG